MSEVWGKGEELLTDDSPTRRLGRIFLMVKGPKLEYVFVVFLVNWYHHRLEKALWIPQVVVEDHRYPVTVEGFGM